MRHHNQHQNRHQNNDHMSHRRSAQGHSRAHNPEGHNQYTYDAGHGQQHQGRRPMQEPSMRHSVNSNDRYAHQNMRSHMENSDRSWSSSTHPRDQSGRFTSGHPADPSYGRQQAGSNYQDSYDRYDSPSRGGRGAQNTWSDDDGRFDSRNSSNDYSARNDRDQRNDYGHYETRGQYNVNSFEDDDINDMDLHGGMQGSDYNSDGEDWDEIDPEELDNRRYYNSNNRRSDFIDRDQDRSHLQGHGRRNIRGNHRR